MMIYNDGEKQLGWCKNGISHGTWQRTFHDGSIKTEVYAYGELLHVTEGVKAQK
jgi:hypothetical protein